MSRSLHWFNLGGVLALAVLCAFQWGENRRLNRQTLERERVQTERQALMEANARAAAGQAAGQAADLASLRAHLARIDAERKETAAQRAAAEAGLRQASIERDQLKSSVTNWAAAAASRDERLQESAARLRALAAERDQAVQRFNDLAARHNALVKEWNDQQSRLAASNAPPPAPP